MATDKQKRLLNKLQNLDSNSEAKETQLINEQIKAAHSIQLKGAFIRARMKYWPENEDLPDSVLQYEKTKQTTNFLKLITTQTLKQSVIFLQKFGQRHPSAR